MKFNLFGKSSFVKFAAVASLVFAFSACSDSSSNVTYVMYDEEGNEHPVPSDLLKSSSSVKKRSSSSSVAATSSSSAKTAASSSSKKSGSSSSAKAVSSSSVKSTVSSSSAKSTVSSSSAKTTSSSSSAKQSASSSSKTPASSSNFAFFNEGWREDCLAKINEYRATEDIGPLVLASEEKQVCTEQQAAADMAANKAHSHFGDCGERAQNSGLTFSLTWQKTASASTVAFLKMMWDDEKALVTSGERDPNKNEDYPYIGHYLNMKGSYKSVACGISLNADSTKGWLNINFY